MSGSLTRVDGQTITEDGSALLVTDTGQSSTWYISGTQGLNPYPFSAILTGLEERNATSFTFTIDGQTLGPFTIDTSA